MRRTAIGWIAVLALLGCGESETGDEGPSTEAAAPDVVESDGGEDVTPAPADVIDDVEALPDVAPDTTDLSDVSDVSDVEEDAAPAPIANLVINEVVVKAVENGPDWIEIRNLGGTKVVLEGWGIRDQLNAHEYLFPAGAEVPAGGYFVVWGKGSGFDYEMDFSFAVDAEARLFAPDQETMVDKADWEEGDAPAGTSWGRFPDGVGDFTTLETPTQGKTNKEEAIIDPDAGGDEEDIDEPVIPPPAQVQINEVLVIDGTGANCWVEIYNSTDVDADLSGWYATPDALTVPPAGITGIQIPAGGHGLLECNVDFPFVLTEEGSFWLMNASGIKADKVDWTAVDVPQDQSFGRSPDGGDDWMTFLVPTPGAPNEAQGE